MTWQAAAINYVIVPLSEWAAKKSLRYLRKLSLRTETPLDDKCLVPIIDQLLGMLETGEVNY